MKKRFYYFGIYLLALFFVLSSFLIAVFEIEGNFIIITGFIGDQISILKIVGINFFIVAMNFVLAEFVFKRERVVSYIFGAVSLFVSAIIFVSVASRIFFW